MVDALRAASRAAQLTPEDRAYSTQMVRASGSPEPLTSDIEMADVQQEPYRSIENVLDEGVEEEDTC
jgi:hypothetical protein